ncbi:MAG: phosphoglycerate transporter, partial [Dehalococcoidia bacterium]|nr:phosphoglycerate transporter [Dehalococcoidia bacterium]
SYGLPLVTLSSQRFRREHGARNFEQVRLDFDRDVLHRLEGFDPDLCALAGYMLYTGPELCRRFTMINLHPAMPTGPIGTWQEVIWQLIQQRATETGAMIHLATEEWDRGPAITFFSFPITGPVFDPLWEQAAGRTVEDLKAAYGEELPLFQRIRQAGAKREQPLLVETIRAIAQGKVKVAGRRVTDAQGRAVSAYCLNDEIEGWLKRQAGGAG